MYSPQRHKVPFRKSPNTSPAQASPKRKSPERLTFEEFFTAKRSKHSSSPIQRINATRTVSQTGRLSLAPVPRNNRLSLTPTRDASLRSSPIAKPRMSLNPVRGLPSRTLPQNEISRTSPSRPNPIQRIPPRTSLTTSRPSIQKNVSHTILSNSLRTSPIRPIPTRRTQPRMSLTPARGLPPIQKTLPLSRASPSRPIPSQRTQPRMSLTPGRSLPAIQPNASSSFRTSPSRPSAAPRMSLGPNRTSTHTKTSPSMSLRSGPRMSISSVPIPTRKTAKPPSIIMKKPMHPNPSPPMSPKPVQQKIKVCVRKRPLNDREMAKNEQDIAHLSDTRTIQIYASRKKVDLTSYVDQHSFTFDEVFDSNSCNKTIYQKTTKPLVEYMFQGGKATCFAYGQTGSGKTYTMLDAKYGLYIQATSDIFKLLATPAYRHLQAWVGYYEIYQGQLYDLLNGRRLLKPLEDGRGHVRISGLKEHVIQTSETMQQVFNYGNRARTTCKTQSNDTSSRSHAVLQILLKTAKKDVHGKLNFIDLAGSERGTDRGSDAKIRLEGAEINKSLLALKECIRALDKEKNYAPFRGSKLTMVLKDSFVGKSRTCMIATVSPNQSNSDHTLNTLRYADRVKELRGESDPRLSNDDEEEVEADIEAEPDIEAEEKKTGLTKAHVAEFVHWHQVEVAGNEMQLQEDIKMMNDFEFDLETITDPDLLDKRIMEYKRNVQHLLDRKSCLIENLKNRIAKELVDEHEM